MVDTAERIGRRLTAPTRLARNRRRGLDRDTGDAGGEVEGPVDGGHVGTEEGALLQLGVLAGDEEGWTETLGDPDGEVEGPVDGGHDGSEGGALLQLGLLEGDEEGWAETLGDPAGEVEGLVDG